MKHAVILVGADKGGVGKTTVSRALLDFLDRKNVMARAFDTENPRGTLQRIPTCGQAPPSPWRCWLFQNRSVSIESKSRKRRQR